MMSSLSYKEVVKKGLTGGAGKQSAIFQEAIKVGRKHGINFEAGNPNHAAGNCLYESLQDNINTRSCFTENLNNVPEFFRHVWNIEGEKELN